MTKTRKRYSPQFKLKAILEILKEEKTAAQLAGELEINPMVLSEWKKQFLEKSQLIFERPRKNSRLNEETKEKAELYEQIGRWNWNGLKKNGDL